jgi:hypothetical protein
MALTKLTVLLTEEAAAAIVRMQEHGIDSKTDSINRALLLYAWWLEHETSGFTHHVRDPAGNYSEPIGPLGTE